MISPNEALLGVCASIVVELLKFIPWLRVKPLGVSLVTIAVVAIGSFFSNGAFTFEGVINSLAAAFISYHVVVKQVASATGLRSQN
jgi:hypothetical protein